MKTSEEYKQIFEEYFNKVISSIELDLTGETIVYVLSGSGKRIRPILMLSACDALGVDLNKALPFACALEIIHCSSLVHDDLPCIDNDDYRRGRYTCHKKFGYAQGVLCGDALLNFAYEHALSFCVSGNDIKCLKLLADYSGRKGMLGGQFYDVYYEKKQLSDEKVLEYIQLNKTAKLITAPLLMASILADGKDYNEFLSYGEKIGRCFQIVDDLLDAYGESVNLGKSVGKDKSSGKMTALSVYGEEKAKKLVQTLTESACNDAVFDKDGFFVDFALKLQKRVF